MLLVFGQEWGVMDERCRCEQAVRQKEAVSEAILAQKIDGSVRDQFVRPEHSETIEEPIHGAELPLVPTTDDQLHLGNDTDGWIIFFLSPLQRFHCLLDVMADVDEDIGINEYQERFHSRCRSSRTHRVLSAMSSRRFHIPTNGSSLSGGRFGLSTSTSERTGRIHTVLPSTSNTISELGWSPSLSRISLGIVT